MAYKAEMRVDGGWFVAGPGTGFDLAGKELFPENHFPTKLETERVVKLLNRAFREGSLARARAIRQAFEGDIMAETISERIGREIRGG